MPDFSLDFSPDFPTGVVVNAADLGDTGGVTSYTAAYTCASYANEVLLIGIVSDPGDLITSVQYGGVSATRLASDTDSGIGPSHAEGVYLYVLYGPAAGTNNVTIIASAVSYLSAIVLELANINPIGQPDNVSVTTAPTAALTFSSSLTPLTDNTVIVGFAWNSGEAPGNTNIPIVQSPFLLQTYDQTFHQTALAITSGLISPPASTTLTATITSGSLTSQKQILVSFRFTPLLIAPLRKRLTQPKIKRGKFFIKRKQLPRIIQPAHFIAFRLRPVRWLRPRTRRLTSTRLKRAKPYPVRQPAITRFNQGIAFRNTKAFVADATAFDYPLWGGMSTYPQITKQGFIVGFTTSYPSVIGQDQLATNDHRISGNLFNKFLTMTVTPPAPSVPDTTQKGATIATLAALWSDASAFTGTFIFVAPNFDDGGVFAISGNNLIVSNTGPGIPAGGTVATVTIEPTQ
jgi:hypothetical protein